MGPGPRCRAGVSSRHSAHLPCPRHSPAPLPLKSCLCNARVAPFFPGCASLPGSRSLWLGPDPACRVPPGHHFVRRSCRAVWVNPARGSDLSCRLRLLVCIAAVASFFCLLCLFARETLLPAGAQFHRTCITGVTILSGGPAARLRSTAPPGPVKLSVL
ncbi:hypothetical protein NDU88_009194 [Pleurodeles waltl]|uniref:Uncharacterized protein n=1 Tax=Pleurodeles waltl TaxID=8319 RepID=A0AAV7RYC5_PLEWA|nr:hypothetical protein NDU88_009194 [Pleurodeles waltl]